MIDREHKLLFLHIPKCGGSSVEALLLGSAAVGAHEDVDAVVLSAPHLRDYFPLGRHATLREYERLVSRNGESLKDFRVFTLIRHPERMLQSIYKYRLRHFDRVSTYYKNTLLQRTSFRLRHSTFFVFLCCQLMKALARRPEKSLNTFVSSLTGIDVRIFRLEDVSRDMSSLREFLGLPDGVCLGHMNAAPGEAPLRSVLLGVIARRRFADIHEYYKH
jgi:hypothetical protein